MIARSLSARSLQGLSIEHALTEALEALGKMLGEADDVIRVDAVEQAWR